MFGRNDGQDQPIGDISGISLPGQQPAPSPQFATPTAPIQDLSIPELSANTDSLPESDQTWPTPSAQPNTSQHSGNFSNPALAAAPHGPVPTSGVPDSVFGRDLASLKQQALSQLTPLVGHLEQTPEEKFRTTMMMIQAADDQTLIKDAYDAAQQIPDEKAKAQALLDVINEINYFSQKQQPS